MKRNKFFTVLWRNEMKKKRTPKSVNTNMKRHIWCNCLECNMIRENFNALMRNKRRVKNAED